VWTRYSKTNSSGQTESERGPFFDPETTYRTIQYGIDRSGCRIIVFCFWLAHNAKGFVKNPVITRFEAGFGGKNGSLSEIRVRFNKGTTSKYRVRT
jgi:hypothetical protein